MRVSTILPAVVCCLISGCVEGEFDVNKVGELHFVHTTVSNGNPIQYEWRVPADELQPILKQMTPRDPKYDGVFVSGTQTASLSYEGKEIPIVWSRVKMAETVILITIRGNHYMLQEPHAGRFYDALAKHQEKSSQQPPERDSVPAAH